MVRLAHVSTRCACLAAVALLSAWLSVGPAGSAAADQQVPPDEVGKPLDVATRDVLAKWHPDSKLQPQVLSTPAAPPGLPEPQVIVLNEKVPSLVALLAQPPAVIFVVGTYVPDLRHLTLPQARTRALEFGFQVQPDAAPTADLVTSQEPLAKSPAQFGSTITLTFAPLPPRTPLSPRTAKVPRLKGLSAAAARSRVESVGLRLVVAHRVGHARFEVASQTPGPGTFLAVGQQVRVSLVSAAGQVTVPDLSGRTRRQAERALTKLGLELRVEPTENSSSSGVISHQSPRAGSVVDLGSTVAVTFSAPVTLRDTSSPSGLARTGITAALLLLMAALGAVLRRAHWSRRRRHRQHRPASLEVRPRQDGRPAVHVTPVDDSTDGHEGGHEDVALSVRPVVGAATITVEESR